MKVKPETWIFWAYTILIFSLSSVPGREIPSQISYYSLLLHFILYFFYGIAIYLYFQSFVYSYIFGVVFAFSDEVHQYFVPGRSCDPIDFLVDSIALATALILLFIAEKKNLLDINNFLNRD